jgi:hypothetical protein
LGNIPVSFAGKTALATSPVFTPTVSGQYCFLTIFTPARNGNVYNFAPTADTNGTTECFMAVGTTAITLSEFEANAVGGRPIIAAILVSLVAIVAGATVRKLKSRRRQSIP